MTTGKLSDLTPDKANANKGTQRGLKALDKSLRQYGAGRSILIDRKGRVIAGNKTLERSVDIGLEDVIIAIEISPEYCAVALERMAQAFPGIEIERMLVEQT
jgi:hypothetical protein